MTEYALNEPELWINLLPQKTNYSHKYNVGYALIYAAPELIGATRLVANACIRMGTGITTVLSPEQVLETYQTVLPASILVKPDLNFQDDRVTVRIIGSGGVPCKPDLNLDIPTVLDAGAFEYIKGSLSPNYILTPHEGEFQRLFPDIEGNKMEKASKAAKKINAYIVLKGSETVIASPKGKIVINMNSSPELATAGAGDVLAGIIGGLISQKMPLFEAACAAVWIHGECGIQLGKGLIADDIPDKIPEIYKNINNSF